MAQSPEPLRLALRAALEERGYSVRGFAKACFEADPRQTWDSWKRTINKALDEDGDYTPSQATAELWAKLLKKPKTYFVRQRSNGNLEKIRRLEERVAELEKELARVRKGRGRP